MIRWFAKNDIAANFLLVGILALGYWSATEKVALEVQPSFQRDRIEINVPYRGGSPADVEKGVILPIEAALEGLSGVKEIDSRAGNGNASVVVAADSNTNLNSLLEEVKTRVERIRSFPPEIDPPNIAIPDTAVGTTDTTANTNTIPIPIVPTADNAMPIQHGMSEAQMTEFKRLFYAQLDMKYAARSSSTSNNGGPKFLTKEQYDEALEIVQSWVQGVYHTPKEVNANKTSVQ